MQVAGIQHSIAWEDPAANFSALSKPIADAAASGAELVVLSEMFSYGFSMTAAARAESPDGPSIEFLVDQSATHGIAVCGSVPILDPAVGRPTNQLVVASRGDVIGRYNKIHPFTFASEHEYYAAGTSFLRLEIGGVRCTFFVCYDLRFADEFWRTGPETDLFVVVANWPEVRRTHWSALLLARAIENQTHIIGVNRVGTDGSGLTYSGDSIIVDPLGEYLAAAQPGHPETIVANITAEHVTDVRGRFGFLEDRR